MMRSLSFAPLLVLFVLLAPSATLAARNLLATSVTHDYTAFCSPPRVYAGGFSPGFLVPFDGIEILINADVCNLLANIPSPLNPTGPTVFDPPSLSGTFTEEVIPGGRRLSLHLTGSGSFFTGGGDVALNYTASNNTAPGERFLGVGITSEGFLTFNAPPLNTAQLRIVTGTVTQFKYDLVWEVKDGSALGTYNNLTYKDIVYNPSKASFVFEEVTLTLTGPLRPTSHLKYPLGSTVIIGLHQKALASAGGKNFPVVNDLTFDLLSPDARSAEAERLMMLVVPSLFPAPKALPAGGVCDASGFNPFQCYASNGATYVCCGAPCPERAQGVTPSCT